MKDIPSMIYRALALCCLIGEVGKDFVFYEKLEEVFKRTDMPNPYRNPDRTIISLIRWG